MVSWEPIRNEVVHLLNSGHKQEAISITKNRGADHVARLETEMLALTAYARNKATYFMDYSEVRHLRLEKITTILTGSGVLLSFLIALMAVKRIAKAEKVLLNEKIKLQRALDEIKTLRGIIPICAHCKQIRDDMGSWTRLEEYIHEHSEAQFSHGICPDCMKKYYPQEYATISKKKTDDRAGAATAVTKLPECPGDQQRQGDRQPAIYWHQPQSTGEEAMTTAHWPTQNWPEGVPHELSGYDNPLFQVLDDAARDYPNQTYTIFNDASRTFAQVKDTADRIANFLYAKGIRQGDRVAIFLPNLPHYPAIFFGIIKAGAVCVTCNPLYTPAELNYQLKDAGARALFCMDHPQFYPTTEKAIQGTEVETVVVCNVKSYLPWLKGFLGGLLGKIPHAERHVPGHLMFDDIVASAQPAPPAVDIDPAKDLALIIYTGGTTGVPKGAALTHSNFMYDLTAMSAWLRLVHEDGQAAEAVRKGGYHCYLGVLPWYHSFGMTCAMLSACASGSRLICVPDPRAGDPPFIEVLKLVQKHRPTLMPAVPTIFVAFANHPMLDQFDLTSIMGCFSGGAPLPPEVCKQFEEKTGAVIFEGYGLSETAPVATVNPTFAATRKIGSIGFPLPGTDIKILDAETSRTELPQGEDGEVAISGPQVMQGYWNKPDETAEVFREIDGRRYFLTGDIGHVDEDGYVTITDRKKDMILVGGFNVYPREVEDILFTHPKVAIAAVVGVPDAKSGEAVKAFIQLKPGETCTEEELREFCKTNMAGYKRPKMIEFRDTIPVSNVGKVLRRVLRDEEREKA